VAATLGCSFSGWRVDAAALSTIDDQAWELTGAESSLAVLKADARRLVRAEAHS
jgi:hypothetical protein